MKRRLAMTRITPAFLVVSLLLVPLDRAIPQQAGKRVHVKIWDVGKTLGEQVNLDNRDDWQLVAPGSPSDYAFTGDVILENERMQICFLSQTGEAAVYSRANSVRDRKRMTISLLSAKQQQGRRLSRIRIAGNSGSEVGLQVCAETADGEKVLTSFHLGRDSVFLEIKPIDNAEGIRINYRSRFVAIPEFFGDDTVFDPCGFPGSKARIPSEGLLLSFIEGEESIVVNTWPLGGSNRVEAALSGEGSHRAFEALEISFSGKSIFAALIDAPGIWHAESLGNQDYLSGDVPLTWKKPFEAKWRADFCGEDGTDSWEFERERKYGWSARFARRITFPCWFEEDHARVCLIGREYLGWVLVYPIERTGHTPVSIYGLDDIMRETLGVGPCEYVLDRERAKAGGREEWRRPLRGGVCETTSAVQHCFMRGIEARESRLIADLVDDAVGMITRTRERIERYREFAASARDLCRDSRGKSPALHEFADKLGRWADDIDKVCAEEDESMRSPRIAAAFGEQIKELAGSSEPENLGQCMMLGRELRVIQSSHEVVMARARRAVSRIRQVAGLAPMGDPDAAKLGEKVRKLERKMIGGTE